MKGYPRTSADKRRLRLLRFSRASLAALLTGAWVRVHDPQLPADTELQDLHYDYETDAIWVRVWSSTYDSVEEGVIPPMLGALSVEVRAPSEDVP